MQHLPSTKGARRWRAAGEPEAGARRGLLAEWPQDRLTAEFRGAYGLMGLARDRGGLGIRPWMPHADAAHAGMWVQALQSAQVTIGRSRVGWFPALERVHERAAHVVALRRAEREARGEGAYGTAGEGSVAWEAMARESMAREPAILALEPALRPQVEALAGAWERSCVRTAQAYKADERTDPDSGGHWLVQTGGDLARLDSMQGMQRSLSQAVKRIEERKVKRQLRDDKSLGARRRRQRHMEEKHPYAGDAYSAMPWQEEGQLHLPNDVVHYMLWQRYRLRVPRKGWLPPRDCRCGYHGPPRVGGGRGAEEYAVDTETERAWLEHAGVCCRQAKLWIAVHDQLVRVWVALLRNAGFVDVKLEPRDWDVRGETYLPGEYQPGDKRRPDITCRDPRDGGRLVFDVTVCWREEWVLADGTRLDGAGAHVKEQAKVRAYAAGLQRVQRRQREKRERQGTAGTIEDDWRPSDRFVPLGFEVGGAWGPAAQELLREVAECARGQRSVELYGWSAATYTKHWRQRIGCILGRGRAQVIAAAVTDHHRQSTTSTQKEEAESAGGRNESQEYDPDASA